MADDLRSQFASLSHDTQSLEQLRERVSQIVSEALARVGGEGSAGELSSDQSRQLISALPQLTETQVRDLAHDDDCPICFTPFTVILAEEEEALAMDSPAYPVDELGVTRLAETWQCGHLFCRRDISRWIHGGHGSCPTCRRSLVDSNSGDSTQEPTRSPDDAELIAQIRTYMEEMRRDGAVAYVNHEDGERFLGEPLYTPAEGYVDDRSEFSGMYS